MRAATTLPALGGVAGALLVACAGASSSRPPTTAGTPPPTAGSVAVVRLPGCCAAERAGQLALTLERRLAQQLSVTLAQAPTKPPASRPAEGRPLAPLLERARALYIQMHMTAARKLLRSAWRQQRRSGAAGATAADLALLHAYLVAVSDAVGDRAGVEQHSEAAVRFAPNLPAADDIFTPSVQQALARAKRRRQRLSVTIRSRPVGATAYWDGTEVGQTPVTLHDQGKGAHLLRLEYPLAATWAEQIDLTTSMELRPELRPADLGQVGLALRAQPSLGRRATQLLRQDVLLLLDQHPQGLALTACSAEGPVSTQLITTAEAGVRLVHATRAQAELARRRARANTPATRPSVAATAQQPAPGWKQHLRRYWWAYALVGTATVAGGVALPLALSANAERRDLLVEVP